MRKGGMVKKNEEKGDRGVAERQGEKCEEENDVQGKKAREGGGGRGGAGGEGKRRRRRWEIHF